MRHLHALQYISPPRCSFFTSVLCYCHCLNWILYRKGCTYSANSFCQKITLHHAFHLLHGALFAIKILVITRRPFTTLSKDIRLESCIFLSRLQGFFFLNNLLLWSRHSLNYYFCSDWNIFRSSVFQFHLSGDWKSTLCFNHKYTAEQTDKPTTLLGSIKEGKT